MEKQTAAGFTLIELAIALMVIGLLIGGVLKGQELIENARIIRVVKDVKDYDTAVMIFRSTYNTIPGDMKLNDARTRLPNCDASTICGTEGSPAPMRGDGSIDGFIEMVNFWVHMGRVGLLKNTTESTNQYVASPPNSLNGFSAITKDVTGPSDSGFNYYKIGDANSHASPLTNTIGSCATIRKIDDKMDDGKPLAGDVRLHVTAFDSQNCYNTSTLEYLQATQRTMVFIKSGAAN